MFHSLTNISAGYRTTRRWLFYGLLALFLGLFSAAAFSRGTVLFEDHFDDVSSFENWDLDGSRHSSLDDQMLNFWTCTISGTACNQIGGGWSDDSYGLLKREPERNFDLSVKLWPEDVPQGRIILGSYVLVFSSSDGDEPGVPMRYNHATLTYTISNSMVAEAAFAPVGIPVTARVAANGGTIKIFIGGNQVLAYTDHGLTLPGRIGLGQSSVGGFIDEKVMRFDDFVLKALPDIRCSPDSTVDGKDRPCEGGLFDNTLWAYLGPDDERIVQVDFYLDGRFHRSEFHPPFELDGGKVSRVSTGPHEIKAKVFYKDGTRASFIAGFEVGEHSLRCSPDSILDGNDGACEGGTFDAPTWVYWWPEIGVKSIDYFVDGILHRSERLPPYELDGGAVSTSAGAVIRAIVQFKDGRKPLTIETHATWAIAGQESLICSTDAVFDGGTDTDFPCSWYSLPGPVQAYLWPEDGIRYVDFYLDGAFHRTERYAPFELDGGAKTDLPAGVHDITSIVHYFDAAKPATAISTQVSAP